MNILNEKSVIFQKILRFYRIQLIIFSTENTSFFFFQIEEHHTAYPIIHIGYNLFLTVFIIILMTIGDDIL